MHGILHGFERSLKLLLSQKLHVIFDYLMITIGSFVAAIGLGLFLVEAEVIPGGVTGISMVINFIFPKLTVGALIWILNVPLFIWGIAELGNSFGVRTFYGFSSNAFFIDLLRGDIPGFGWLHLQDTEPIVYLLDKDFFFFILIGSLFTGIGLGMVFKFKGTTAGTEILCAIIKKRLGISPGISMMSIDFFVISAATAVFYFDGGTKTPAIVLAFYALFSLYVSSILLDKVVYGFDYAHQYIIFSNKNQEISDYIIKKLDRGVTAFYARGMYTNQDKEVLLTVVGKNDARELTPFIKKIDPSAFIIQNNVNEVLGEGFRSREEVDLKFIKNVQKREAQAAAAEAAQAAIRAEIDAQAAEQQAIAVRESAKDHEPTHTLHEQARLAEDTAHAARLAAESARAHAVELENVASSIENCIDIDSVPSDDVKQ